MIIKRLKLRRDTTENWNIVNPILEDGELGIEKLLDDTRKVKLGNGVDNWNSLSYLLDNPASVVQLELHIDNIDDAHGATDVPTANHIVKYNADLGLQSDKAPALDNDVVRKYELDIEELARATSISGLQTQVDLLDTTLNQEISGLIVTDNDLQSQIDELSSIIAIRGSVDTYAHLPDPTTLKEGEAYIVEEDENHDNTTSIYSIVDNAGTLEWDYIAKFAVDLSDYYTKTEADALLDNKLDSSEIQNYYTKTETDTTFGNYYTKTESDNRYISLPVVSHVAAKKYSQATTALKFKFTRPVGFSVGANQDSFYRFQGRVKFIYNGQFFDIDASWIPQAAGYDFCTIIKYGTTSFTLPTSIYFSNDTDGFFAWIDLQTSSSYHWQASAAMFASDNANSVISGIYKPEITFETVNPAVGRSKAITVVGV
jgi:hypothetical protein